MELKAELKDMKSERHEMKADLSNLKAVQKEIVNEMRELKEEMSTTKKKVLEVVKNCDILITYHISDHMPVVCEVSCEKNENGVSYQKSVQDFSKFNVGVFLNDLNVK